MSWRAKPGLMNFTRMLQKDDYVSEHPFSFSPTERFIQTSYYLNYLLHSERVNPKEVFTEDFRDTMLEQNPILQTISTIDFDSRIELYRQTLPSQYLTQLQSLHWNRRMHSMETETLTARSKHDARLGRENILSNKHEKEDNQMWIWGAETSWDDIRKPTKHLEFQQLLIKHHDENIITPIRAEDKSHLTYNEFINNPVEFPLDRKELALITPKTRLYQIDLHKIHFKHSHIVNSGDINLKTKETYSPIENIARVQANSMFFENMMEIGRSDGVRSKLILPLCCYFVNGRLYSQDHKRIFSSLCAGKRYIYGAISQNIDVILRREIGHYPEKCLFSGEDKSMMFLLTPRQADETGHYFLMINGGDYTPLMKHISSTTLDDRNNELALSGSKLLGHRYSTNPVDAMNNLHCYCYPSFFQSLDNTAYLIQNYLDITKLTITKLTTELQRTDCKERYLASKCKYRNLKQDGGTGENEFIEVKTVLEAIAKYEAIGDSLKSKLDKYAATIFPSLEKKKYFIGTAKYRDLFRERQNNTKRIKSAVTSVKQAPPKIAKRSTETMSLDLKFYKEQYRYVNRTTRTIEELLSWELTHMGNSFWYIFHNRLFHPAITNLIDIKYPFIRRITPRSGLGLNKNAFTGGALRYGKTDDRQLEDLVMVFRALNEINLGNKQTVTSTELITWQRTGGPMGCDRKYPYLQMNKIKIRYGGDGLLSDSLMERILRSQASDHLRIFQKISESGVKHYGAYQGLNEQILYTHLKPCPDEMLYAIHLTKKDVVHNILEMLPTQKGIPSGYLVKLGRYIHAFGWAEYDHSTDLWRLGKHWPMETKPRLFERFRNRVGVGVYMAKLKEHYENKGTKWTDVCGINDINTVIFLQNVPPECIGARGRKLSITGGQITVINAGEPYSMEEIWGMEYDQMY